MKTILRETVLYPLLVLIIAYLTYFRGYDQPPYLFWDENYHIASAEKYLSTTFFQEPHPPLGKLLIALGEKIVHPESDLSKMHDTMHAKGEIAPTSFSGFRLAPALLSFFGALIFYLIMREISASPRLAFVLSSLYLFDNALIVHLRSAMLEGPQLFFLMTFLLLSLKLAKSPRRPLLLSAGAGCAFAAALNIKINSLDFAPLFLWALWPWRGDRKILAQLCVISIIVIGITTAAIWGTTYAFSRTVNPKLENQGFFSASSELKEILTSEQPRPVAGTFYLMKDYFAFLARYTRGVPALNYCKDSENGSYPLLWPLGAKTISYRWNRSGDTTSYLYLVPNPAIWWTALAALLATCALLVTRALGLRTQKLSQENLLIFLLVLYLLYMVTVLNVTRALYLYHYFIPLILTFMMVGILASDLSSLGRFRGWSASRKAVGALCWVALCVGTFLFYAPLTYYSPLTIDQFERRSLLKLWDMTCAGCSRVNPIARPIKRDEGSFTSKPEWRLHLGDLTSTKVSQSWGEPREGVSVTGERVAINGITFDKVFGVHARSEVIFALDRRFSRFSVLVGLPDYLASRHPDKAEGSVEFEIYGDDKKLWSSGIVKAGTSAIPTEVDVSGVKQLKLLVTDAADGRNYDHACWVNPELR
jgi:dolichyl-phosphate-mannose-protein mannosyltransferase